MGEVIPKDSEGRVLTLGEIELLTQAVRGRHGLRLDHVEAVSELIVAAERDECPSHGVYRLAGLVRTMKSGR